MSFADAAGEVSSPQIRKQGTLGGNISQDTRCWYYLQPGISKLWTIKNGRFRFCLYFNKIWILIQSITEVVNIPFDNGFGPE